MIVSPSTLEKTSLSLPILEWKHFPYGSDWTSIRKAGMKAEESPSLKVDTRQQALMENKV